MKSTVSHYDVTNFLLNLSNAQRKNLRAAIAVLTRAGMDYNEARDMMIGRALDRQVAIAEMRSVAAGTEQDVLKCRKSASKFGAK